METASIDKAGDGVSFLSDIRSETADSLSPTVFIIQGPLTIVIGLISPMFIPDCTYPTQPDGLLIHNANCQRQFRRKPRSWTTGKDISQRRASTSTRPDSHSSI